MATAMTFNSLLEDLKKYLERGGSLDTEVLDQLPSLINLAERNLARALKVLGTQNIVISAQAAGTAVYAKPDRWRETVSMNIGLGVGLAGNNRKFLYPRSYEYCRAYWPNSDERDEPEFYCDYGFSAWLIVPTPVQAYNWEITYYQQPAFLDAVNQTNWLTEYAPDALLYRSLIEAETYLKHDERVKTWEPLFGAAIAGLDGEDLQRIVD